MEAFITAGLAALTLAAFAGWFIMAHRPQQWSAWVERENDFWRDKGVISFAWAERLKRWEKGRMLKFLAGVTTCIGVIGLLFMLAVWMKVVSLHHQKLRMPYNPALQRRVPAPQPRPKRK